MKSTDLAALTESFLGDMQARRYSPRSVSEYAYSLRFLLRFLAQKHIADAAAVGTSILADFPRWLSAQPTPQGTVRSAGDINKTLAVVRSFFRFLKREAILPHDPSQDMPGVRQPDSLPRNVLTPQEAKKILESIDTTTAEGYRDRAIMEVFYATGIRLSELCNLELSDVNFEEGLLRITGGKGAKDRVVPLGRIALQFLETYAKAVRPQFVRAAGPAKLFASTQSGRSLHRSTVEILVTRHARRSGVKKHVTPHVWRHTCATHLLKNNANLRHVQDLLGHGSLSTTERYLRLTITDLKEAHQRFHPREKQG